MKKRLVFAVLVAAGWFVFIRETPARWRGMPASAQPVQTTTGLPAAFRHHDHTITPLATYSVTAVVLNRCHYRFDPGAKLAPLDLALGWGPMSIAGVINELEISQSGRWYEYSYRDEPPLDPDKIAQNSANTHCLPASKSVRRQLLAIKRHDLVTLTGYLVEISGPNGYHWRSSLTRDDTRGGSCEVLWVTGVSRQKL